MNKNMNKSKIYMIICVCVLFVSILGTSLAYYRKILFNMEASTITYGLDYYINYAKGQDISGVELLPAQNHLEGASSDIELWKKDETYDIYGHIYLDINEIGTNLSQSSALKYTLTNNGNVLSEGMIKGNTAGDSILISANIPLQTTKQLYTMHIWMDKNKNPGIEVESEVLSLTVRCEATMKPIDNPTNLLQYINNLYLTNYYSSYDVTSVDGTVTSYYAPSVRLMNDGLNSEGNATFSPYEGNIRYYGADDSDLKNYIYFNCSDYSNQSDSTCEKWRIIGIVDGKVKLVRDESIGDLAWDQNKNIDSSLTTFTNNWEEASLQLMLNDSYYNGDTSGTITYYSGSTGDTSTSLDMDNIGFKNDTTRNLISSSTWYLGGYSTSEVYPNQMYKYERTNEVGTTIKDDNPFTITGNVGIMYVSDYGYATDLSKCTETLKFYNSSACKDGNWLYTGETQWLTAHRTMSNRKFAWSVTATGVTSYQREVTGAYGVRPVIYLDPNVIINSGDGSSSTPYQIYVESKSTTLINYITNLYARSNPTLITHSRDDGTSNTYYYSYQDYTDTWGLMNDGLKVSDTYGAGATKITNTSILMSGKEGNIRYFGPSDKVNNYIYFNCETYPDTNCELWRIIGIIDGKVKIIRSETIGGIPWDSAYPYENNWNTSTLNAYLNGNYYNSLNTKNSKTVGLISQSTYYLGGYNTSKIYSDQIYNYERIYEKGTTIYGSNPYTINAKIGLLYASDYGYATDFNECSNNLDDYGYEYCYSNNWLYDGGGGCGWLLTPRVDVSDFAWLISKSGVSIYNCSNVDGVTCNFGVRPVLYLNSELVIELGTSGSSSNPYRLAV